MFTLDWPLRWIHSSALSSVNPAYSQGWEKRKQGPEDFTFLYWGTAFLYFKPLMKWNWDSIIVLLKLLHLVTEAIFLSLLCHQLPQYSAMQMLNICYTGYWYRLLVRPAALCPSICLQERPFGSNGCLPKESKMVHSSSLPCCSHHQTEVPLPQNTTQA